MAKQVGVSRHRWVRWSGRISFPAPSALRLPWICYRVRETRRRGGDEERRDERRATEGYCYLGCDVITQGCHAQRHFVDILLSSQPRLPCSSRHRGTIFTNCTWHEASNYWRSTIPIHRLLRKNELFSENLIKWRSSKSILDAILRRLYLPADAL